MAHEDVISQIAERVSVTECVKCKAALDVSDQPFFTPIECPQCHARQFVPARLGNFLLLELLGKGGMAGVYRAYDETLGRQVAIKVMRRELGEDPKFIETFLREARAAAQLNHRNIVSIHAVGEEKGQPFIVMELLDGGRFDLMIAEKKVVDEVRALEVALDVAEGLKAANDIGLVHGDIKPANILFDRSGTAKVADFGLARFQTRKKTSQGEIWGTPYYIAPEKVRSQREDHRSDIYSLGATLYHALGGKPPFEGDTATDVVLARLEEPAIRLSDIRPDIHPKTAAVIARMLEPDPQMRYPTYASLISDLRATLRELRLGPAADGKTEKKARRKVPAAVWMAAAVILVIAGTVTVLVLRHYDALRKKREAEQKAAAIVVVPEEPPTTTVPVDPAASPPPPPDTSLLPVQPFSADEQVAIATAARELAVSRGAKVDDLWAEFVRKLPLDHPGRPWGQLFYGLAPWLANDDQETQRRLQPLADREFEPQEGGIPHPGVLPRAAARFILGRPFEKPPAGEGREWPAWFETFMDFLRAYERFKAGQPEEGVAFMKKYMDAISGGDPTWPFAFRPVAEQWQRKGEEWARFNATIDGRLPRGQHDYVLREIEKWRNDPQAGRFMPGLEQRWAQTRADQARRQAEADRARQEAERKAYLEKVQGELDRLDQAREEALPLVVRRDFRGAAELVRSRLTDLATDEARQALALTVESFERMEALRRFVVRSVPEAPFTGARRDIGGDIVGASLTTVSVSLAGGAGSAERSWDVISPRVFADMASFYLGRSAAPAAEKGELALAMALYAYYNGGFRPAAAFAENAVKLNPELRARARQFMPGLLPDSP